MTTDSQRDARGPSFSALEVARGKPAPDLFLLAAATMGFEPSRCVVVEDSPFGVTAAHAAGMTVIGYSGGLMREADLADADVVIDDMAALPTAVAALLQSSVGRVDRDIEPTSHRAESDARRHGGPRRAIVEAALDDRDMLGVADRAEGAAGRRPHARQLVVEPCDGAGTGLADLAQRRHLEAHLGRRQCSSREPPRRRARHTRRPRHTEARERPRCGPSRPPLTAETPGGRTGAEVAEHALVVVRVGALEQVGAPQRGLSVADLASSSATSTLGWQRDVAWRSAAADISRTAPANPARLRADCLWTRAMKIKVVIDGHDLDVLGAVLVRGPGIRPARRSGTTPTAACARAWPVPRAAAPLLLQRVPEAKTGKNRLHLDLHPDDGPATVDRLVALGASRAGRPQHRVPRRARHDQFQVMADPEGNEFCVVWRTRPADWD